MRIQSLSHGCFCLSNGELFRERRGLRPVINVISSWWDQKCSAIVSCRKASVPAIGSLLTPGLISCQKSHSIHRSVVPRKRHLSLSLCLFSRSLAPLLFFDSSRPSHFSPSLSPYHSITFPLYLSLSFST